ncbi:hypothetical protein RCL1_003759 [Eukaryota sp. TZLM3-RCL]
MSHPQCLTHINLEAYRPGSIVAVTLSNITVFSSSPQTVIVGPAANWVLGCNGSGKSTVIDSIGLALGVEAAQIGRGCSLIEYLSRGSNSRTGKITVYLHKGNGELYTISRKIFADKPKKFQVTHNNEPMESLSHHQLKLKELFNIDLSSLIQFTPQFKLEDLTKKTPAELLSETEDVLRHLKISLNNSSQNFSPIPQRRRHSAKNSRKRLKSEDQENNNSDDNSEIVAQNDVLFDPKSLHDLLNQKESSLKKFKGELASAQQDLATINNLIRPLEEVMDRFNKKKVLEVQREALKIKKLIVIIDFLKSRQVEIVNEIDGFKAAITESEGQIRRIESSLGEHSRQVNQLKSNLSDIQSEKSASQLRSRELSHSFQSLQTQISQYSQKLSQHRNEIQKLDNQKAALISELNLVCDKLNELASPEIIAETKQNLANDIMKRREFINENSTVLRNVETDRDRHLARLNAINAQIDRLRLHQQGNQSVYNDLQVLSVARQLRHVIDANKADFQDKIFGPIFQEISFSKQILERKIPQHVYDSITDQKFQSICNAAQSAFPLEFLTSFVVTNHDDERKLRQLMGKSNLKFRITQLGGDIMLPLPDPGVPPVMSNDFQQSNCLYCYGIDLIQGPPEVITAIIQDTDISRLVIGSERVDDLAQNPPRGSIFSNPRVSRFFSFKNCYSFKRARYTSGGFIDIEQLRPYREIITVDRGHDAQLRQLMAEKDQIDQEVSGILEEIKRLVAERSRLYEEEKNDKKANNELDLMIRNHEILPKKRSEIQSKLDRLNQGSGKDISEVESREQSVKNQLDDVSSQLDSIKDEISTLSSRETELKLQIKEIMDHHSVQNSQINECKRSIESNRKLIHQRKHEQSKAQKDVEDGVITIEEMVQEFEQRHEGENLGELLDSFPNDRTELTALIKEKDTMVERIGNINLEQLRDYDKQKTKQRQLNEKLENFEADLLVQQEDFNRIKALYLELMTPPITTLSETFTKHFRALKCQGAIDLRLPTGEFEYNFSKTALEILVAFRANRKPCALSNAIQSGGERALSILVFLLSLQSIASCPVRILDESNRGLDAINEAAVMKLVVNRGNSGEDGERGKEDAPQYIVSSPKLLDEMPVADDTLCVIVTSDWGFVSDAAMHFMFYN